MGVQRILFVGASIIFICLNVIENLIHYNIGRASNENITFANPTWKQWLLIILTMIIFAVLQGGLTLLVFRKSEGVRTFFRIKNQNA